MIYLRRQTVCEKLRIGLRQSYRIVGSSYGDRISSDDVIVILNRSRRATAQVEFIPSDLMTPEETAFRFSESEITERELRNWIHRTKNTCPHFRLNSHTIRFSKSSLENWLRERSRIRRHS